LSEESRELQTVSLEERMRRLEATDAPLTQGDAYNPKLPPPKPSFGGAQFIIMAVISVAIAYFMVGMFAPKLSQYKSDITRLELDSVAIRANYATISSLPKPVDLTPINSQITAIDTKIGKAEVGIAETKSAINVLTSQVNGIKPFDPTSLLASNATNATASTKNATDITALNTQLATAQANLTQQYNDLKTKVADIKPADLTAINTNITAIQASITAINTQLATPITRGIDVTSITSTTYGTQAIINSSTATYALATIKYTFASPITPAAPPTLAVAPFGSMVTGSTVSLTWDSKEQQIAWLVRVALPVGPTTLTWQPSVAMASGLWSINVEVIQ
jgi:hypothetical protein